MTTEPATGVDGGSGGGDGTASGRSDRARRTSNPAAPIAATSTSTADPMSNGEWSTVVTAGGVAGRTGAVDGVGRVVGASVVASGSSVGSVVDVGRPGVVVAAVGGAGAGGIEAAERALAVEWERSGEDLLVRARMREW